MKRFLKILPLPVCGIMLALISLGSLLKMVCTTLLGQGPLGNTLQLFLGTAAVLLLLLIVLKIIVFPKMVFNALKNPEMLGIFCTFPMTLMLTGDFFAPYLGMRFGAVLWWSGVVLHLIIMVVFTLRYVIHFKWPTVLPPWYIVYTGFSLCGLDAPRFASPAFGAAAFRFGFICFWILFVLLLIRYRYIPVQRKNEPFYCINAAVGICTASYVRAFVPPAFSILLAMLIVNLAIYVAVLCLLPGLVHLPFYPSDAAFSFPFVVAASASMQLMMGFKTIGITLSWLPEFVLFQTALAAVMVLYALWRYGKATARRLRQAPAQTTH